VLSVTFVFQKGKKEYLKNNRLISLTSIPGKVMEQLVLKTISRLLKDMEMISTQHGFTKGKSCLTKLIIT